GIAELLKDGPRSAQELAEATGANPRALYQLLRALASIGIFEDMSGFVLTPLAECLLDPSMKALATVRGEFQPVPGASCSTVCKPAGPPLRRFTASLSSTRQ